MNSSSAPTKIYTAWGSSAAAGYVTAVPQTTTTLGAASWTQGWGPETFLPANSGGTAPLGDYFNGAMNQISDNLKWLTSGNIFKYDATYATNIGGYANGAIVMMASTNGFWVSTVDNNLVNPETGTPTTPASGWKVMTPSTYPFSQITGVPSYVLNSSFTGTNQSLVANGYQKFPGGLMMQWCDTVLTGVVNQISTITYPTPFPSTPGVAWTPTISIMDTTLTSATSSQQIIGGISSFGLSSANVILGNNGGGARTITVHLEVKGRWA